MDCIPSVFFWFLSALYWFCKNKIYYSLINLKKYWYKVMGKSRGFTLIELIVAIAVFAVVVAMAAPSFMHIIRKQQLNDDAKDFVDQLVELRSDAILKQKTQTLSLAEDNGEGDEDEPDPDSETSASEPDNPEEEQAPSKSWWPKSKIEWSPPVSTVTYNMMGFLNSDNNLCFLFEHIDDENLKAVIITRRNGMVIYDSALTSCPNDLGEE